MPSSHSSSPSSAPCRLELRPSRQLGAALILLTVLAVAATWSSALAWWQALPVSLAAAVHGLRSWRRQRDAAMQGLVVPWDPLQPVTLDGQPLHDFHVDWRGPLASLRWRSADRRRHRRVLWPDVLAPAVRRELRLAAQARTVSPRPRSMAP